MRDCIDCYYRILPIQSSAPRTIRRCSNPLIPLDQISAYADQGFACPHWIDETMVSSELRKGLEDIQELFTQTQMSITQMNESLIRATGALREIGELIKDCPSVAEGGSSVLARIKMSVRGFFGDEFPEPTKTPDSD